MNKIPTTAPERLSDIQSQFGDEAETYIETRAEAAEAIGKTDDAQKWRELAEGPGVQQDNGRGDE